MNQSVNQPSSLRTRNYGIDSLRLIAMFYVIILHVLGQGGVIHNAAEGTPQYMFSWFMEMWALCAVNIFGMISGYVGYSDTKRPYHYANYIIMWLQVVFYGAAISTIVFFADRELFTKAVFRKMFFPVTNNLYWYFTAYTGLFFVIPLINTAVRNCSETYLKKLFLVILLLFSAYSSPLNSFYMGKGYCFIWLAFLYLLGAILKKCRIGSDLPAYKAILGIGICAVLSWLWQMYVKDFKIFDTTVKTTLSSSYTIPTHVLAAVFHIILFSRFRISPVLQKLIRFAAPGAFAVYIINLQVYSWTYLKDKFAYLIESPLYMIFSHVVIFSLLYVVVCVLIDHIRQRLFRCLRIPQAAEHMTHCISHLLDKLFYR